MKPATSQTLPHIDYASLRLIIPPKMTVFTGAPMYLKASFNGIFVQDKLWFCRDDLIGAVSSPQSFEVFS